VKKIAAHDHKINFFVDRVLLNDVYPRIEKITRAFRQLISRAAKMNIGDVKETHVCSLPKLEGRDADGRLEQRDRGDSVLSVYCGKFLHMEKVVLITGASSGIGRETAKLFQAKNWKVAATMRSPENDEELGKIVDLSVMRMDVTDVDSIRSAVKETLNGFGRIDAVVNNAGYGLLGPFEAASIEQIDRQFQTNLFGMMNVCRGIIPYFREQKRGTIVNISSLGGRAALPFSSVYSATKFAVEGFSESLYYELEPFNIRVRIIEPGPIKTDFYGRSGDLAKREGLTVYDHRVEKFMAFMNESGATAPDGRVVAQAIYDAATDDSKKLRYRVNTKGLLVMQSVLPETAFRRLVKTIFLR
jgi:NAD(P)-dependent dehydrogenase (short-subunit alcohol dehydrogenase family)